VPERVRADQDAAGRAADHGAVGVAAGSIAGPACATPAIVDAHAGSEPSSRPRNVEADRLLVRQLGGATIDELKEESVVAKGTRHLPRCAGPRYFNELEDPNGLLPATSVKNRIANRQARRA
jgi:hypothetical protein